MADELISKQALLKKYCKEPAKGDCDKCDWQGDSWCRCEIFGVLVDDFPAVDAVEVVRCAQCIYSGSCEIEGMLLGDGIGNPYCAGGERRADE